MHGFVGNKKLFLEEACDWLAHTHQGCFTGTGAIFDCASASQAILEDMGKMSL